MAFFRYTEAFRKVSMCFIYFSYSLSNRWDSPYSDMVCNDWVNKHICKEKVHFSDLYLFSIENLNEKTIACYPISCFSCCPYRITKKAIIIKVGIIDVHSCSFWLKFQVFCNFVNVIIVLQYSDQVHCFRWKSNF